jgi:hypothetical protein
MSFLSGDLTVLFDPNNVKKDFFLQISIFINGQRVIFIYSTLPCIPCIRKTFGVIKLATLYVLLNFRDVLDIRPDNPAFLRSGIRPDTGFYSRISLRIPDTSNSRISGRISSQSINRD